MKYKFDFDLGAIFNNTVEFYIDDSSVDSNGVSNIEKAISLEYGRLDSNPPIPPRPFWKMSKDIIRNDSKFIESIINNNLDKAGERGLEIIHNTMDNGDFEPLKDSTIKARESKGNFSIQPTVDTGSLKNSIKYEKVNNE